MQRKVFLSLVWVVLAVQCIGKVGHGAVVVCLFLLSCRLLRPIHLSLPLQMSSSELVVRESRASFKRTNESRAISEEDPPVYLRHFS